jgi:hypothetical protein
MESAYIEEIKDLVLSKNELGITEVRNLKFLKGLNYDEKSYPSIAEAIKQKKIDDIILLPQVQPKTFEDVTLFSFYDQNNNLHIVSIYDSDELWQDPVILDIFPQ